MIVRVVRERLYFFKKKLRQLRPGLLKKKFLIVKKLKNHYYFVKKKLNSFGFTHIKKYSLSTWKYYGEDLIRFTVLANCRNKKYIIKCGIGFDKKIGNSIRFQNLFGDVFDFVPKGKELAIDGYKTYITEFIDSVSFDDYLHYADLREMDFLLKQANIILDYFNEENIVHCDLESVNVLIQKKSNKMYIIDFDTCCSEKNKLFCDSDAFPNYTIKQRLYDRIVYDDAYSFFKLFERYKNKSIVDLSYFCILKEKIGRNIHTTPLIEIERKNG